MTQRISSRNFPVADSLVEAMPLGGPILGCKRYNRGCPLVPQLGEKPWPNPAYLNPTQTRIR
jgi:hypothetical protein